MILLYIIINNIVQQCQSSCLVTTVAASGCAENNYNTLQISAHRHSSTLSIWRLSTPHSEQKQNADIFWELRVAPVEHFILCQAQHTHCQRPKELYVKEKWINSYFSCTFTLLLWNRSPLVKWANAANLIVICPLGFKYLQISKVDWADQDSTETIFQFRGLWFCIMGATITSNGILMPPLK